MKRLLIVTISVLLIFNCARILHKKPLTTENITVREIRNRIEQNHLKLTSIKGRAHLTMEMPGMGVTATSQIILLMPTLLSIKVKAGFGMGIGSVLVKGDKFIVYSAMENRAYYGDVESFDLSQFFQVKIKFQDLIELISGIPVIEKSKHSTLSIDNNKYLISIKGKQQIKRYWIDPDKFVVTDFHLYDNKNELIVKQEFRQFKKEKGVILPKLIKINRPQGKERIILMYTNRKTNAKVISRDFTIKIPDNTQKINL